MKSKRTVNEAFSYESFEGVLAEATDSWKEEVEEIQYFHLDIIKEGSISFSDVDARLAQIKKDKEAKAEKFPVNQGIAFQGSYKSLEVPVQNTKTTEQPTLFQPKVVEDKLPFEPADEAIQDHDVKANPKLIQSLCLQLLTGSVMIPNESKIDIKRWVNSMKSVVERRFGTHANSIGDYQEFVEYMVEFLVWNTVDPAIADIVDGDYMMTVIATGMFEYIGTLPKNVYTEICQNALLTYIQ